MRHHTPAWYERNEARCHAILAYLDNPTPETEARMHELAHHPQLEMAVDLGENVDAS